MGCNCSREEARVVVNQQTLPKNNFIIRIHPPNSENIKIIMYQGKTDYMLLSELINNTFLCGKFAEELDANFISVYDKAKDCFEYYIQRLLGYEIEKEEEPLKGKLWVPYINKEKQSWSNLCGKNRVVNREDEIELKYEHFALD
jgi:hypothetical protein